MSKFAGLFRSVADREQDERGASWDSSQKETAQRYSLLFVDDEEGVLKALRRIFVDENYQIHTAGNAAEALRVMAAQPVHLIISDHRMPGMSGAEMLKEVKQRWPQTIRIMLTGYADVQSIMGAVNEGAVYKFITKPWNDEDLRLTVSLALQQYELMEENRRLKKVTKTQQEKLKNYGSMLSENRGILESILTKAGLVTKENFLVAWRQKGEDEFITEALDRLGLASESRIARTLQQHLGIETVDLREVAVPADIARILPRDLCRKNRLIPIRFERNALSLAMADPSDMYKCDNLATMTGFKILPFIAFGSEIRQKLDEIYGSEDRDAADVFNDIPDLEPIDEVDIVIEDDEGEINLQELISSSEIPPIIRIVNCIISEAVRYKASDIHIEPKTKYSIIRYRIDGILHTKIKIPTELHPATISRIKILGKLDIAERRKPQDGRITVKSGTRMVDIRLSTMPTISGEKVVMRILDKSAAVKDLGELGLLREDRRCLHNLIRKPQGIVISTGPTGSGKTTLLYAILNEMMQSTRNFETIEDPVEYFLEGASQVYVKEKIGLSFASVLRATLRQDPDVILVGEVRDPDTANVAFKAALTGHMVLTTLHTNTSIGSITRLIDLGIKPYLIASALEGVVAQRLVRRICPHCKSADEPHPELLELLNIHREYFDQEIFRGKGCFQCNNTGYLGRVGLFEIFMMNDDFRHFICESYRESELLGMARSAGMITLIEAGAKKVKRGETTLDELVRVIGPQIRHERHCHSCRRKIDAKFHFCPYCGVFKQAICLSCKMPLEEDWQVCAFCGEKRTAAKEPEGVSR